MRVSIVWPKAHSVSLTAFWIGLGITSWKAKKSGPRTVEFSLFLPPAIHISWIVQFQTKHSPGGTTDVDEVANTATSASTRSHTC